MFHEIYEGNIFRPPSEARSLILQATIGCSWNRCIFCTAFAGKEFRTKTLEDIKNDVEKVYPYYKDTERIFLADGNALCMDTDELESIIRFLYSKFHDLKRVNIYGGPIDIKEKSHQDLVRLREAGLKMIYFGLESGSAEVLKRVKKGATPPMMVEAARKVKEAGIEFSTIFILGLGGQELSLEHAAETARVLSGQDPDYAAALTLMLEPGAPIIEEVRSGRLTLITPEQALLELRTVVSNMEVTNCIFRSNHASNYVPIGGTLPGERDIILEQIDEAGRIHNFKPEYFRRL
jgi:radical SAM superfamily enzyme YgiQ (UPF0313 family)